MDFFDDFRVSQVKALIVALQFAAALSQKFQCFRGVCICFRIVFFHAIVVKINFFQPVSLNHCTHRPVQDQNLVFEYMLVQHLFSINSCAVLRTKQHCPSVEVLVTKIGKISKRKGNCPWFWTVPV